MFMLLFPWWVVGTILWSVAVIIADGNAVALSIFVIYVCLPPAILSTGILTKQIKSRVQLGSWSNRNAAELLLTYSLVYAIYMSLHLSCPNGTIDFVYVCCTFIVNLFFPWLNHRTLLADTKFWRGLGRCNQGGLEVGDALRSSGVDVHRPTMELNFVTSSFQEAMAGTRGLAVDFAFLQLQRYLGQGAAAKVYQGKYRNRVVAIKLNTPPEVDEDVIQTFLTEATVSASLKHRNIVEFVGICIRPPQIGMVFEFCEGGNLKTSILKQPAIWSSQRRLRACLDAASGLSFMHENLIMHRDIKAENFLVGKKMVVKLGDFGESTYFRTKEAADVQRMTILGTVAFMAPELIAGERFYTEAIDIYALAVTFWEIWTGKDPYDGLSTFDIYDIVNRGERPPIPDDAPPEFVELLRRCWATLPEERPHGPEIVEHLEKILKTVHGAEEFHHEDGDDDTPHPLPREGRSFSLEGITSRISLNLRGQKPNMRDIESAGAEFKEMEMTPSRQASAEKKAGAATAAVMSPFHATVPNTPASHAHAEHDDRSKEVQRQSAEGVDTVV